MNYKKILFPVIALIFCSGQIATAKFQSSDRNNYDARTGHRKNTNNSNSQKQPVNKTTGQQAKSTTPAATNSSDTKAKK